MTKKRKKIYYKEYKSWATWANKTWDEFRCSWRV